MVSAVLARMVVRQYRDLFAWQTAEGFKLEVYRIIKESVLVQSDYKFRSQILEAARSVPSNITEGFLRCSPGDFMRFLDYAVASLGEAERRLHDGIQLGYFPASACQEAFRFARRCAKACVRLKQSQVRYLNDPNRPAGPKRRTKRTQT
jgi:four helix bundle protein